jgi:hypothetical protein
MKGKINQVEWDVATITANDYTVEMKIRRSKYKEWYEKEYKKPGGDYEKDIPPAMSFKMLLARVIEERLTAQLEIYNR